MDSSLASDLLVLYGFYKTRYKLSVKCKSRVHLRVLNFGRERGREGGGKGENAVQICKQSALALRLLVCGIRITRRK